MDQNESSLSSLLPNNMIYVKSPLNPCGIWLTHGISWGLFQCPVWRSIPVKFESSYCAEIRLKPLELCCRQTSVIFQSDWTILNRIYWDTVSHSYIDVMLRNLKHSKLYIQLLISRNISDGGLYLVVHAGASTLVSLNPAMVIVIIQCESGILQICNYNITSTLVSVLRISKTLLILFYVP